MTQQEYLTRLQEKLIANMSHKETDEIITDYKEYFQSALTDGKNESEICLQLGEPENLAVSIIKEIKSEDNKDLFRTAGRRILRILFAIGLICAISLIFLDGMNSAPSSDMLTVFEFIAFLTIPLFAFYLFCGKKFFIKSRPLKKYNRLYFICLLPIIIGLIFYCFNGGYMYYSAFQNPLLTGSFCVANLFLLCTYFFSLACMAFLYGLKYRTEFISLTYPALGMVMFTISNVRLLRNLLDPVHFTVMILQPFIWVILSVGMMFAAKAILHYLSRSDKESA